MLCGVWSTNEARGWSKIKTKPDVMFSAQIPTVWLDSLSELYGGYMLVTDLFLRLRTPIIHVSFPVITTSKLETPAWSLLSVSIRFGSEGTRFLSLSAHLHQVLSGESGEEKVPQVSTGECLKYRLTPNSTRVFSKWLENRWGIELRAGEGGRGLGGNSQTFPFFII